MTLRFIASRPILPQRIREEEVSEKQWRIFTVRVRVTILVRKRERPSRRGGEGREGRARACRATMNGHGNLLQHSRVATAFQTFLSTWKSLGKTRPTQSKGGGFKAFLSAAQLSRQLSTEGTKKRLRFPGHCFRVCLMHPGHDDGRETGGKTCFIGERGGDDGHSSISDDKFAVLARDRAFHAFCFILFFIFSLELNVVVVNE